ncbi:hypothetical protein F8271_19040 [Micromonospora sp. ALFpr18c]|uniref:hypothetical protein n=1 Tax=Micromonospora sp. ALFpr18c TaxID=1458665 RepID=UPI00124B6DBB|nr:hypothetical protein [Micromonospora sp. ALFpr18c]KAB1937450.1 hypothetical protein F8271_19040 [Micromonospora sp. ALFpr18c]
MPEERFQQVESRFHQVEDRFYLEVTDYLKRIQLMGRMLRETPEVTEMPRYQFWVRRHKDLQSIAELRRDELDAHPLKGARILRDEAENRRAYAVLSGRRQRLEQQLEGISEANDQMAAEASGLAARRAGLERAGGVMQLLRRAEAKRLDSEEADLRSRQSDLFRELRQCRDEAEECTGDILINRTEADELSRRRREFDRRFLSLGLWPSYDITSTLMKFKQAHFDFMMPNGFSRDWNDCREALVQPYYNNHDTVGRDGQSTVRILDELLSRDALPNGVPAYALARPPSYDSLSHTSGTLRTTGQMTTLSGQPSTSQISPPQRNTRPDLSLAAAVATSRQHGSAQSGTQASWQLAPPPAYSEQQLRSRPQRRGQ